MSLGRVSVRVHDVLGLVVTSPLCRFVPSLPHRFRKRYDSPKVAWPAWTGEIPEQLRGAPGTVRDPGQEAAAFAERPLPDFLLSNPQPMSWLRGHMWEAMVPLAPRMWRAQKRALRSSLELSPTVVGTPSAVATDVPTGDGTVSASDQALTDRLKQRAAELGLSAVGVTRYDEKYIYAPYQGQVINDRVVVCILEQAFSTTQAIPSAVAERTALNTYAECQNLATSLSEVLTSSGYRVQVDDPAGRGMYIPFAVEAGLGQLGLNGQLLTPNAGSRCRIILIFTDAPLTFDTPRDFGIPKICDTCQVCVRRCPPGAIPAIRHMKRGVEKAPINTKRCLPVMGQAHGCAVCMKVCPVQKYGLNEVLDHFRSTGEIRGKGSDELEGFHWPADGNHYGPGQKPRITPLFIQPREMGQISFE